uniref:Cystinosin-like protein n=1 Tax=Euplotes crassus TaxID=5936 RepID=A0A7S3KNK8_EUPCR|mmetsp:Transcript_34750/g.34408  ORF Transcript_34750/g.34408 Transcript_34750/m.34408 type:complete len:150 (+) Transcript_34750:253-702(+)
MEGVFQLKDIPPGFNTFRVAGYNKALITLLKYMPQVYLNWKRKSTVGWSIFNILCDFTGGAFSIAQEVIDNTYCNLTRGNCNFFGSGDSFNIIKFLLGVLSIFFDIIFMIQHYYLYPQRDEEAKKPLLEENKEDSGNAMDSTKKPIVTL